MIIYKVTNKVNNKVYIGQTIQDLDSRLIIIFIELKKAMITINFIMLLGNMVKKILKQK